MQTALAFHMLMWHSPRNASHMLLLKIAKLPVAILLPPIGMLPISPKMLPIAAAMLPIVMLSKLPIGLLLPAISVLLMQTNAATMPLLILQRTHVHTVSSSLVLLPNSRSWVLVWTLCLVRSWHITDAWLLMLHVISRVLRRQHSGIKHVLLPRALGLPPIALRLLPRALGWLRHAPGLMHFAVLVHRSLTTGLLPCSARHSLHQVWLLIMAGQLRGVLPHKPGVRGGRPRC